MNEGHQFRLSGVAVPVDVGRMFEEVCEHFVEHADVRRGGDQVRLQSEDGVADIRVHDNKLLIDLSYSTPQKLQLSRTMLAEHLFYFAGEEPLDLSWSQPPLMGPLPNLQEVTVLSSEDVTPHMRRVTFSCPDVSPYLGGDMHVRVVVPPKGRQPVWPGLKDDGRIAWPEGEDELLVRVYTIRSVDAARRQISIDFFQHPEPGIETPGADFARAAQPGDQIALLGPGGGERPDAHSLLLAGDESALPAIARIVAEMPAGTRIRAIIEVLDSAEEQPLPTDAQLDVLWLHRRTYAPGATGTLVETTKEAIETMEKDSFIWFACEKDDVRAIRKHLRARGHDRARMYVAWYWERQSH